MLLFIITKQKKWVVRHLNFENAFPNGSLEHPVFIEVPSNLKRTAWNKHEVFKLKRSLYGVKDAAKYGIVVCQRSSAISHFRSWTVLLAHSGAKVYLRFVTLMTFGAFC